MMFLSQIGAFKRGLLLLPVAFLTSTLAFTAVPQRAGASLPVQQATDLSDKAAQQALLDELDDIDIMRSINPLKLTGDQIDKLIVAIDQAKVEYDKRISDLGTSTLGKLADEIHKHHKEMLKGGEPSKDFDNKIKAALAAIDTKRDSINYDNFLFLTGAAQTILTKDQKAIAVQMEKDIMVKMGKKLNPSEKDTKFLTAYVVDLFVNYRRIVPLLKLLKSSAQ